MTSNIAPVQHKKLKLTELYAEAARLIEKAEEFMNGAITALCNHNKDEMIDAVKKTIETEKSLDRIHDAIMERMFTRETLVFSRADRLSLINEMDDVVDMTEMVVRRMAIYMPDSVPATMLPHLIAMGSKAKTIGTLLKEACTAIFTDFDTAEQLAHKIEDVRRASKEDYMRLLEELYKLKMTDFRDFLFFDRLVRNLMRALDRAESCSDSLRMLVLKYKI